MCKLQTVCKLHKGPFAFNLEKFPSLGNFYTHAVTGVTDNYQVCGDVGLVFETSLSHTSAFPPKLSKMYQVSR